MLVSFNKILHIELLLFDLMHDLAFFIMLIYMYFWCQDKIPRKKCPHVRDQSGGGAFFWEGFFPRTVFL